MKHYKPVLVEIENFKQKVRNKMKLNEIETIKNEGVTKISGRDGQTSELITFFISQSGNSLPIEDVYNAIKDDFQSNEIKRYKNKCDELKYSYALKSFLNKNKTFSKKYKCEIGFKSGLDCAEYQIGSQGVNVVSIYERVESE